MAKSASTLARCSRCTATRPLSATEAGKEEEEEKEEEEKKEEEESRRHCLHCFVRP